MEDRKKIIVVAPAPQDAERLKTILEESGEFVVSEVLRDLSEAKSESVASGVVMVDIPDLPSSDGDELSSREKEILVCECSLHCIHRCITNVKTKEIIKSKKRCVSVLN